MTHLNQSTAHHETMYLTQLSPVKMQSNNLKKKIQRKSKRHQHVVTRETEILCCDHPTEHLAFCNFGQVNGLNEAKIVENYHGFGAIDRIHLVPRKSVAFISFKSVQSAIDAFETTNGRLKIAQNGSEIYLSFVEHLPELPQSQSRVPTGLMIIEDFVTTDEEKILLGLCKFDTVMKHRQVKHFGYEFRYDTNNVDKDCPLAAKIPKECHSLWGRLPKSFEPDQLTVNHYEPGQGIPPHIDTHSAFEDPILSLSLSSPVVMEFKKGDEIHSVLLPQKSLLIMTGESRYAWTHGITPRKFDYYYNENGCVSFERGTRVSFTFRKILHKACQCSFPNFCDSQRNQIFDSVASKLEQQHVHDVYNDIADHFSETRHKPWPRISDFVLKLAPGSCLVDIGCGNGKYFGFNKSIIEIGTDSSLSLNNLCREKKFEIFTSNCLSLPLKDVMADAVISIAVIHHLSTEQRRYRAISEIVRILKKGGQALIYVWAKQQIKNDEKSTYIKQDRKNRKNDVAFGSSGDVKVVNGVQIPVHTNRTDFSHSDVLVPWKLKEKAETFFRYYHVFEEGELQELCQRVEGVVVLNEYYDQGNYCVLLKKK